MKASTTVARHRASRAFTYIACACVLAICAGQSASAAIPAGERLALMHFYEETGGPFWYDNLGWGGAPGTECEWRAVVCNDDGTHVVSLWFYRNNLSGTLSSLDGLPALQDFGVENNKLRGTIPDLSRLANLIVVNFSRNEFTGTIPALPANIFFVQIIANRLTGSIPSLSGYAALQTFWVSLNHLSGEIPSLSGLHALYSFSVDSNDLEGGIPALDGLTTLAAFDASSNHLTGPLPALVDMPNLLVFDVHGNNLTGTIPSLDDSPLLTRLNLDHNRLTGAPPPAPLPPFLGGTLCPNFLDHVESLAWDEATGVTPWYRDCVLPDAVFANGFEA